MKTLNKFYLISLVIAVFISCSDDDPSTDPTPPEAVELEFTLETNQDQMGDFSDNAIVEYDGKLYSVGGINDYSYPHLNNDVWNSVNGVNWRSQTSGMFEARFGHTLTDFNANIWLIGGSNEIGHVGGIWYSPDGDFWTELSSPTFSSGLSDHSTYIFGTKLYFYAAGNGIWSTPNGFDWTQENPVPFPKRIASQIVVLDGVAYCIGGYVTGHGYSNEIWRSTDGINWTQVTVTGDIFSPRGFHTATVYNNKIWVIGGDDGDPVGDIWYTSNGSEWHEYEGAIPFSFINGHTVLNYRGELWLFGGHTETGISGKIYSIKEI